MGHSSLFYRNFKLIDAGHSKVFIDTRGGDKGDIDRVVLYRIDTVAVNVYAGQRIQFSTGHDIVPVVDPQQFPECVLGGNDHNVTG